MNAIYQPHASVPSPEAKRAFIERLVETGNVLTACAKAGLPRPNVYYWRARDEEFSRAWELALAIFEDHLTAEVVQTARALGTGTWRPKLDADGKPILDDDFEVVMELDVSRVDARILAKLIDKRVRSVEGPSQTAVIVNNTVNTGPRPAPRLIRPSLDASDAILDAELAETFEAVLGAPHEPCGAIPELED